jgi:hypothetical protein
MNYKTIINNQTVPVAEIPELSYYEFLLLNTGFLIDSPERPSMNSPACCLSIVTTTAS